MKSTKVFNSVLISVSTTILILSTAILAGGFQSQGTPPEITFDIDFPGEILADGEKIQSFVFFKDEDQDIVEICFELTKPQMAEPLSFDPQVKGNLSGVIPFSIAATSPTLEICVGEEEQSEKIHVSDAAPEEVTLKVVLIDEAGNESEPRQFSFKVEPLEKPNQAPVAKFSYSPAEPEVGEEVTFDASDSKDPDGEITRYEWDFGDGSQASGKRVAHGYSSSRSYTVKLEVTDDEGLTDSTSETLNVIIPPPVASFTASPTSGAAPLTVRFSNTSQGAVTRYSWDFGDGDTSEAENPRHTYRGEGSYTVSLTVWGPGGQDTERRRDLITVRHPGPGPANGELLYEDDFSDPNSGWCIESAEDGDLGYKSGEYSISSKGIYWMRWCDILGDRIFTNVGIVVEAHRVTGAKAGYGILFRKQDNNNFYYFEVSTDGSYLLSKKVNNQWHDIIPWTSSKIIKTGNQTNQLGVVVYEQYIALWANGTVLQKAQDQTFRKGEIALAAGTFSQPNIEVHFDNLKVYQAIPTTQ